jgi:Uma2 family endonuclease
VEFGLRRKSRGRSKRMSVDTHVMGPPAEAATVAPQRSERSSSWIWRLNVQQYHEMIRAGILTENDPVELIDGLLVTKMPKNPPHILASELVRDHVSPLLPAGWFMNSQQPVTLAASEPEPDAMVVRGSRFDYRDRTPVPGDVALVIEVSDTTLDQDRGLKKRLYAEAGIAAYWIVNLIDRRVEVYTEPSGPSSHSDYRQLRTYAPGEEIALTLDGREAARVAVQNLLP